MSGSPAQRLGGLRAAVPVAVARAVVPELDDDGWAALVEDGVVLQQGDTVQVHPLHYTSADPAPLVDALRAHCGAQVASEDVEIELLRLECAAGDPTPAALARLVRRAVRRGTAARVASRVIDLGLLSALADLDRARVLRLLVEGGHAAMAEALVEPEHAPLRARAHVRSGEPTAALALLDGAEGAEAALVRGQALLNLGRSADARAVLPTEPIEDPDLDLERVVLTAVALVEAGRADEADELLTEVEPQDAVEAMHVQMVRARLALRLGRLDTAARHVEALRERLADDPAPSLRAAAEFVDALIAFYAGNHARLQAQLRRLEDLGLVGTTTVWAHARAVEALARSAWDEVEGLLAEAGSGNAYGIATMRAWVALQRGRLDEARAHLDSTRGQSALFQDEVRWLRRVLAHQLGEPVPEAGPPSACATIRIVDAVLDGKLALEAGDAVAARAHAANARSQIEEHGVGVRRADVLLLEADIAARTGDMDAARTALALARRVLPHPDAPQARLVKAADAVVRGSIVDADDLETWRALPDPAALAILEGDAFRPWRREEGLRVGRDGAWFRLPGADPVTLANRRAQARILDALARARVDGARLTLEELVAEGWPDERIVPTAAHNRVHVALTGLRRVGLGTWIVRDARGYGLDADRPVVRVDRLDEP